MIRNRGPRDKESQRVFYFLGTSPGAFFIALMFHMFVKETLW